ncbi:MAG: hypothetical protein QUT30_02885 [Acidobacteriota bacterium]|nr:hypothetical protein [Acidobacteriota bacterium]
MTIQRRSVVVGALLAFAFILYGTAKLFSPALILYVVEQSLIQKAPAGINTVQLHKQLHAMLDKDPDQNAKMKRLLRISGYLEKVQHLTPEELNDLLVSEHF